MNKPTQVDAIYDALSKAGAKGLTSTDLSQIAVRYACAVSAIRHQMNQTVIIKAIKGTKLRRYVLGQFYKKSAPEDYRKADVLKVLTDVSPSFIRAREIGWRLGKDLTYVYGGLKNIKNLEKVSIARAGKAGRPAVAYRVKP